jgi:hypothetical protein
MVDKLSGDVAYELFMSAEPFPLENWLETWRKGTDKAGFALAVVHAYDRMVAQCGDGRYGGVIRR